MSFLRPEAKAALWRWRELLAAAGLGALGAWWTFGTGGLLGWIGAALIALAGAIAVIGLQRGRFRMGAGGPGVVVVDEGEITYLGPLTGGSIAVAGIDRLALDPTARPAHWVLGRAGAMPLCIPVNAEGAEALFDAFATLPGLRTERMLAELGNGAAPVVIWERPAPPPAPVQRLH
jgi:hypothetical protein